MTTPRDPGYVEILFRADEDDRVTWSLLDNLDVDNVTVGPRLEGYRSLPTFFQELFQQSHGDLIMCGNDDMVFRTREWASRVLQRANDFPDGVFNLGVSTFNEGNFPFSIISRKVVETLGFIHDPRIFWGDIFLRDVMSAFGRAILLPDVRVDHNWVGHHPDQTFREADQGNLPSGYWEQHEAAIRDAVEKLRPLVETCVTSQ
jgi:hypothetical protein